MKKTKFFVLHFGNVSIVLPFRGFPIHNPISNLPISKRLAEELVRKGFAEWR